MNLIGGMFTENGKRSWGRVSAFIALIFSLLWVSKFVWLIKDASQFSQLPSLAIFIGAITGMVGTLYGISKGVDALKDIKGVVKAAGGVK